MYYHSVIDLKYVILPKEDSLVIVLITIKVIYNMPTTYKLLKRPFFVIRMKKEKKGMKITDCNTDRQLFIH